ncbi:uncharacterized protein Z519_08308 [Cladophialophora bantiana CBS 173.52]|uniref:Uncharacterized protein n=1 Tax=Cladophialophora bantiana (strain ATCC 10958 / CBS 173.52 / CDC B-1940 / NIH 8579) TaxID=1442370 RepID=A0A0D2FY73_CLAB1|nr:uncharacterized protein Z519_08308 [Cladophialophora bantiana CBS 173.52]KIW91412.1 hypothetical protein Z519_08308 [Cladophialophora bantiana CBS 173.52]
MAGGASKQDVGGSQGATHFKIVNIDDEGRGTSTPSGQHRDHVNTQMQLLALRKTEPATVVSADHLKTSVASAGPATGLSSAGNAGTYVRHRESAKRSMGFPQVGLPHEKSDPRVARRILETLRSEGNKEQQVLLEDQDEDSSRLGLTKIVTLGKLYSVILSDPRGF